MFPGVGGCVGAYWELGGVGYALANPAVSIRPKLRGVGYSLVVRSYGFVALVDVAIAGVALVAPGAGVDALAAVAIAAVAMMFVMIWWLLAESIVSAHFCVGRVWVECGSNAGRVQVECGLGVGRARVECGLSAGRLWVEC